MRLLNLFVIFASSLSLDSIKAATITETKTISVNDNFNAGENGWTSILADYNQAVLDDGVTAHVTTLPEELKLNGQSGFQLSSSNRADDVYQGIYKRISIPISPIGTRINGKIVGPALSIKSTIVYDVTIASNEAQDGCLGVGGAPGTSVWTKVGASAVEPIVMETTQNYWTFTNIDKGHQISNGPAGSVAGHIGVNTPCEENAPYVLKSYKTFKPKNDEGQIYSYTSNIKVSDTYLPSSNLYLMVGTESGFEARTTVYFISIKATITSVITYTESTSPIETKTITINDNFNSGNVGWIGIFADYNQAVINEGMIATVSRLPQELGLNGQSGFQLSASNRADDVYQGMYKKVSIPVSRPGSVINGKKIGAPLSIVSSIVYDVTIASNSPKDCIGVGGAPGESVYAKFGSTSVQPIVKQTIANGNETYWTFININKGHQSESGPAGSVAGNIAVDTPCASNTQRPYKVKSYPAFQPKNDDGQIYAYSSNLTTSDLYLMVGAESGYESRTTFYFINVKATITAVITYAVARSTLSSMHNSAASSNSLNSPVNVDATPSTSSSSSTNSNNVNAVTIMIGASIAIAILITLVVLTIIRRHYDSKSHAEKVAKMDIATAAVARTDMV